MIRKRRAAWIVGLGLTLTVGTTIPAHAQEEEPSPYPFVGLCIRQVINLPGLDLPEESQDIMLIGQVECP